MKQIERIQYYESILTEVTQTLNQLEETYAELQPKIQELESYYTSPLWKKDFEDDEKGKLPKDLKRGVLSEDGISNVLDWNQEIWK